MSSVDTIFALATPAARSGVAVLRLSGPRALAALQHLSGLNTPTPRMAYYTSLTAPDATLIDRGLALYFNAPHSFTGEDVVELHTHGSLAVLRQLSEVLCALDLRPAEPGEFSRRAYLNGKIDLMEAEGLADLIEAETQAQSTQALRQMKGDLSGFYNGLRQRVIVCLAQLEAYIDFPEEEIPESVLAELMENLTALQQDMRHALQDEKRGQRLREGISIVILGAPNAGKSSLLNILARKEAAIVSARAGTTRDVLEIHMDIGGFPVVLVDTAGLRDSDDDIEAEGIRRAKARAQEADIKLVLFDASQWPGLDKESRSLLGEGAIAILSKSDLLPAGADTKDMLCLSTRSGAGLETLIDTLKTRLTAGLTGIQASFITRDRHRRLLEEALQSLEKSMENAALELRCEDLRRTALAIGKITGKIQVDDVLDVIFSRFCIGK